MSGFYTFTSRLIADLKEAFDAAIGTHVLFLCELGNQHQDRNLDLTIKQRKAHADNGCETADDWLRRVLVAICNECETADDWLRRVVELIDCPNLQYHCELPYAAVWSTEHVTLMQVPCTLHDIGGNDEPDRRALIWQFQQVSTSLDFKVALAHSPSSVN